MTVYIEILNEVLTHQKDESALNSVFFSYYDSILFLNMYLLHNLFILQKNIPYTSLAHGENTSIYTINTQAGHKLTIQVNACTMFIQNSYLRETISG